MIDITDREDVKRYRKRYRCECGATILISSGIIYDLWKDEKMREGMRRQTCRDCGCSFKDIVPSEREVNRGPTYLREE